MTLPRRIAIILAILGWAAIGRGQALSAPAPLAGENADARRTGWMVREMRADRALQSGFPSTAATIYRELLAEEPPTEVRTRLNLGLVTALLDTGDIADAEARLQSWTGARDAAYHLRAGLVAAQARRWPQAREALAACRAEDLSAADRGWRSYLEAEVADETGDDDRRRRAFDEAIRLAVSEAQRLRFQIGMQQTLLRVKAPSEQELAAMRANMERAQGRLGYTATRTYAAALHELKRTGEAEAVLQRQLDLLPSTERNAADEFRLMLGLIAGTGSEAGRRAFAQLVDRGQLPETQRIALQLLARGARTPAERARLRTDLNAWIDAPTPHPLIEELLLTRALVGLADSQFAQAEADARGLLERFPGSALKPAALGVRLSVAWETGRPRTATDVIVQLRALLGPGRERSELGVLLAEAFFRSGDFRSAADAYEAALREAPAVVPAGLLIFQQILAEIRAEPVDQNPPLARAQRLLDGAAANPAFDPANRWQAEWNLVKELQARGRTDVAYSRVEQLLAAPTPGMPSDLRVRLTWLQAKLSFDGRNFEVTLRLAESLRGALAAAADIEPLLKADVAANGDLLRARALLALGRDDEGMAILEKLRAEHRGTQAAIYSYVVQAARLSQLGRLADAQKVLTDLADSNRDSEFAPLALFQAALNAERQGLERNLQEAYNLLERVNRDYAGDKLHFYALVKQGDLLRKLNDFSAARQVYEYVVNNYGRHPDVLLAQLALADTLFALGANSVVNYESAAALYERLRDLPDAPVDLRAEAGFKWGFAAAKRGQSAKAIPIFWSVVDTFLRDETRAERLGATGRYWVARALLELGQLCEESGKLDEARRAYQLIVDANLGPAEQAREKLARFNSRPAADSR